MGQFSVEKYPGCLGQFSVEINMSGPSALNLTTNRGRFAASPRPFWPPPSGPPPHRWPPKPADAASAPRSSTPALQRAASSRQDPTEAQCLSWRTSSIRQLESRQTRFCDPQTSQTFRGLVLPPLEAGRRCRTIRKLIDVRALGNGHAAARACLRIAPLAADRATGALRDSSEPRR